MVRERLRRAQVTSLGNETDGVGQQVLEVLDIFLSAVVLTAQRGQRLRQCAVLLLAQASGQCQRADEPVPDPLGVRRGGGEMTACRASVAAVEADYGARLFHLTAVEVGLVCAASTSSLARCRAEIPGEATTNRRTDACEP